MAGSDGNSGNMETQDDIRDSPDGPLLESGGNCPEKAKGEEDVAKGSVAQRLQASGRLAMHAVAGSSVPETAPGHKAPAGPSTSTRLPSMLSDVSSSRAAARTGEPLRLCQNGLDSSEAFDSFISGRPIQELPSSPQLAPRKLPTGLPLLSFAEQEAADGAAVARLLSLPDDPMDALSTEDDDLGADEAARLRDALFGPGNPNRPSPCWDDMLGLVPDYIAHPSAESSAAAQLHVGTADAAVAQSIWLEQWSHVLSSYTDEVWGDLGPLAAEAKHDVDRLMLGKQPEGPRSGETRALRRLRMILTHVRGRY